MTLREMAKQAAYGAVAKWSNGAAPNAGNVMCVADAIERVAKQFAEPYKMKIEALHGFLTAYRIGRSPSEKTFALSEMADKAIADAERGGK